jgi:hypothetical protein
MKRVLLYPHPSFSSPPSPLLPKPPGLPVAAIRVRLLVRRRKTGTMVHGAAPLLHLLQMTPRHRLNKLHQELRVASRICGLIKDT